MPSRLASCCLLCYQEEHDMLERPEFAPWPPWEVHSLIRKANVLVDLHTTLQGVAGCVNRKLLRFLNHKGQAC